MPSKYVVRDLRGNSYYHVFNRGTEKRIIFLDEQDYRIFLFYIFVYVTPLDQLKAKYSDLPARLFINNLADDIDVVAYCLMPNHFHLLLRQRLPMSMPQLLKQVANGYTIYFNTKYKRVGGLMQGRYRAAIIDSDDLLIHVARYIHLNPVVSGLCKHPGEYEWSSYGNYIGKEGRLNCATTAVMSRFGSVEKWEEFHVGQIDYARALEEIKHLAIDI